MYEFEDISSGFHDVFLNKYSDSSGPIMDLYISDSMQDMLDIDIRSEVATVVGGVNEFTSLMNYDLPSLELDTNSDDCDISWLGGPKWSTTHDIYADVGACVNPNSVMPVISSSILNSPKGQINLNTNINAHPHDALLPSPKEKKSHLTFSPSTIKVPVVQENRKSSNFIQPQRVTSIESIKKDLKDELVEDKIITHIVTTSNNSGNTSNLITTTGSTIKLAAGVGGLTFANNMAYTKLKQNNIKSALHNNLSILNNKRERESSPQQQQNSFSIISSNNHHHNSYTSNNSNNSNSGQTHIHHHHIHQQQHKIIKNGIITNQKIYTTSIGSPNTTNHSNNNNNNSLNSSINNNNNKSQPQPTGQEFPKPAYSYSCLIAMALKNSRTGSLPVSEIYSFMCEHFPYFKTAPNGWKNSVRHNLSLNKCFEKIEKPATNGGQRKGCLWAMNPSKISKMDEEVQKWSRKDPMAIRKAMVFPEHLEALERGEMKHGSTGDSEGETEGPSDAEQSDSEAEPEIEENIIHRTNSIGEEEEPEIDTEFDVEVSDLYDEIDIECSKEALQLALSEKGIFKFEDHIPMAKRARLDVNYTLTPATISLHTATQNHQNRRKMPIVNRIA